MPHVGSNAPGRFRHIDALRGIAALCVVFSHAVAAFGGSIPAAERQVVMKAMAHLSMGRYGVFLFFLISGFVIPFSLRGDRKQGVHAFAVSRFFRLYPLYWASIVLALIAMRLTSISAGELADPFSPGAILLNATMLQAFFGVEGLQSVYWSLRPELVFYALCAVLFSAGLLRDARVVAAAGLVCLALAAGDVAFMMLGLLWRLAFVEKAAAKRMFFLLVVAVCIVAPVIEWRENPEPDGLITSANMAAAVATFAVFGLFAKLPFRRLRWLGEISYSVYLLHLPILILIEKFGGPLLAGAPLLVHCLVALPIILGVSHFAYRMLEAPMIAEGRRLIAARAGKTAALRGEAGAPA